MKAVSPVAGFAVSILTLFRLSCDHSQLENHNNTESHHESKSHLQYRKTHLKCRSRHKLRELLLLMQDMSTPTPFRPPHYRQRAKPGPGLSFLWRLGCKDFDSEHSSKCKLKRLKHDSSRWSRVSWKHITKFCGSFRLRMATRGRGLRWGILLSRFVFLSSAHMSLIWHGVRFCFR